jgi:hypothetical protein
MGMRTDETKVDVQKSATVYKPNIMILHHGIVVFTLPNSAVCSFVSGVTDFSESKLTETNDVDLEW